MLKRLLIPLFLLASTSCDDDPTSPDTTTTTTSAPAGGGTGILRAAQLVVDERTVDVLVNGQAAAAALPYAAVGPYVSLSPGDYRVQFFPAGNRTSAIIETQVSLGSNQAITVALAGVNVETLVLQEDRNTNPDRARVRLVNAVPDFPAAFDLSVQNGPTIVTNVAYRGASGYTDLIPGVYNLVLRRAGTNEDIESLAGQSFTSGSNYTVFVTGTLSRNDVILFAAREGT